MQHLTRGTPIRHRLLLALGPLALLGACQDPASPARALEASAPLAARAAAPTAAASRTVVMDHLDAPRGLAFGPDGAL